jgi:fermentation-respiration switch protein FrsA (DUF1100 family)
VNKSFLSVLLASFLSSACSLEQRFIFHPEKEIFQTPADAGLPFDDVYFAAEDGIRLNGWYIPRADAEITFLWFHGNAGNVSHRVDNIRLVHEQLGVNIFIFDYRGYGRSEGTPSEPGTYRDGRAALRYLRERYGVAPSHLVLFGRSLGAAVAAQMATREEQLLLILESPFVSVPEMARVLLPPIGIARLLSTQYNVPEALRRIRTPVFVLHGDRDEVVPFNQGQRVFAAAREPKRFYAIGGAGHNDTYLAGGDDYFAALREALRWALQLRQRRNGFSARG